MNNKVKIFRLFNTSNSFSKQFAFIPMIIKILFLKPDIVHFEIAQTPRGRYGGLLGEPILILFLLLRIMKLPFYLTLHSIWLPEQGKERIYEICRSNFLTGILQPWFKIFTRIFCTLPNKVFLLLNSNNSAIDANFSQAYKIQPEKVGKEIHGLWVFDEKNSQQSIMDDKKILDDKQTNNHKNEINNEKIGILSRKIVCLGFIKRSKGYEYVIQSMKSVLVSHPHTSLLISGSIAPGPMYNEEKKYFDYLKELVEENSLEKNVTIEEKYLSDEQLKDIIKQADIVVLPYTRAVGASGLLHLSMIYDIPVILSVSGPLFEELKNIVPIVPAKDSDALAKKIIEIFDNTNYSSQLVEKYNEYLYSHDWSIVSKILFNEYLKGYNEKTN
jgi:glycosyltransferase involved in cell wall biosynthesis